MSMNLVLLGPPAAGTEDLGNLSVNSDAPDSFANPFGAGNPYAPDSPRNPYGGGWRIEGSR